MKIRYLNDELRETHNDYRSELAQLARQISETKHQDVTDNEEYVVKIDELKTQLAQMDNSSRSVKRQLDELKQDNQKLQEQVSASVARELEVTNENKKLRSGLTDAVGRSNNTNTRLNGRRKCVRRWRSSLASARSELVSWRRR